jgi:hypothetical protein
VRFGRAVDRDESVEVLRRAEHDDRAGGGAAEPGEALLQLGLGVEHRLVGAGI